MQKVAIAAMTGFCNILHIVGDYTRTDSRQPTTSLSCRIPLQREQSMPLQTQLLCGAFLALTIPSLAHAERLEITGSLETSTCTVGTTGGAITVPMGKVDLVSVNATTRAGQKNFTINLDCSGSGAAQKVGVRFGGTQHDSTGNLALTAASTARNVGVALYDADDNHQRIGDDPTRWLTIAAGGSGQLTYSAWYASPSQNAQAGQANASGDFVVLYD